MSVSHPKVRETLNEFEIEEAIKHYLTATKPYIKHFNLSPVSVELVKQNGEIMAFVEVEPETSLTPTFAGELTVDYSSLDKIEELEGSGFASKQLSFNPKFEEEE